jgi:hypothetical protein
MHAMRNRLLIFLLALGATAPALAANVGISVNIGEPGFYGQLDIGNYPPPALLYPQPVLVRPVVVAQPPIYLRVPPGHARHWDRYCSRYHAVTAGCILCRTSGIARNLPHVISASIPMV